MPDDELERTRALLRTDGAIAERTVHIGYCHHCDWFSTNESWGAADEALEDHLDTSHDVKDGKII